MKLNIKNILREQGLDSIEKQKDMVQDVVDRVYPHIVTNLGPSQYREEVPNVELWNDIYARYSGIPEMRGEASDSTKAEWKAEDNTIYVYYPNLVDIEDIIRSLLHEYSHSLQDEENREENRKLGYDDDPDEIDAHVAEEDWRDYLIYLKDNINESEEEMDPTPEDGIQTTEPFTPNEWQILNYLTKEFTWEELNTISSIDETQIYGDLDKKWDDTLKLFGQAPKGDEEAWIRSTRWAKWAIENWEEACGEGSTGDIYTGCNFKDVTNPIKSWPSWYEVDADEEYWQKEFRNGTIEIGAYDEQDAEERADISWWDYDPDMDHYDYGDTDEHELRTTDVRHIKDLNESIIDDTPTPQKDGYRIGSPFKDLPFIDVDSNRIDMNNLAYDQLKLVGDNGVEIIANNNSGTVIVPGAKKVREIPVIPESQINEEIEDTSAGFTPSLIKFLRYVYAMHDPTNVYQFRKIVQDLLNTAESSYILYLILEHNTTIHGFSHQAGGIKDMLDILEPNKYEVPIFYSYTAEWYGNSDSYHEEDECDEDGVGEQSGNECDCEKYEEIEVESLINENDYDMIPCNEATDKDRKKAGYDDEYDCPCEEWAYHEVEFHFWNITTADIISTTNLYKDNSDPSEYYVIDDIFDELGTYIITEEDEMSDEDNATDWEYFDDNKQGEMVDIFLDMEYSADEAKNLIRKLSDMVTPKQLNEEDTNNTHEPSPDLEIGDRIMVWDLIPDPQAPGTSDEEIDTIPRTLIGTVIDSLDNDEIDLDSFRGGIKYIVRDDSTGEEYGLYGGWGHIRRDGKLIRAEQRDKWTILPPKQTSRIEEILNESGIILPDGDDPGEKPNIPEVFKKLLVLARFERPGGWGRPSGRFILYITPSGKIVDIRKSASVTTLPFKINDYVKLTDLIKFEEESGYSVQMKGRLNESNKILIRPTVQTQYTLKLLKETVNQDEVDRFLALAKSTKQGWMGGAGRKKVFDFLNVLRDSGLVNMFQATDFLWSGSRWITKYIDLHHPEYLEPIDEEYDNENDIQHKEKIQYLIDNADGVRDVIIANVLAKAELKGDTSLEGANKLMRPSAQDMVKLWAQHMV